ncbi:hypothetical protein ABPG72_008012 [Tetrahymena utriculariae]
MRPWLKNKQQNNSEEQNADQVKIILDLVQLIQQERIENSKSRQSLRGEFLFEKIQELETKLKEFQNQKIQQNIEDHFASYISYLINLYINVKGELLDQQFLQKIVQLKMKIQWKSNKFFTIIDDKNEFLVFQNKVEADETNIKVINKDSAQKFSFSLGTQNIEALIQDEMKNDLEIHRLLEKKVSINSSIYSLYEAFDVKQSQKYYLTVVPFDQQQLQPINSISNFLYHIYLSEKYAENISPISKNIVKIGDKHIGTKLIFLIQKPQCTLFDLIKERSINKQYFSIGLMKKIFSQLVEFLFEIQNELNISINDLTVENVGYYKNTDSYKILSLDLLTSKETELVGKIHSLPKEFYKQYTQNEANKFSSYNNSMFQLAQILLQIYNLNAKQYELSELDDLIKQLEEKEKQNHLDDFLKIIYYLFKYDKEKVKEKLSELKTNHQEEVEQQKQDQNKNDITDQELSKKIVEKIKKKKKPLTLQETLNIAIGYYEISDQNRAIKAYKEFIQKSQDHSSANDANQLQVQKDIIFATKEVSQIYLSLGDLNEAITNIRQAAQLCQQYQLVEDLKFVSYDWNGIGIKLQQKGLLKEQIDLHKEILSILEQNLTNKDDSSSNLNIYYIQRLIQYINNTVSNTLSMLGEAYKNVGEIGLAKQSIERSYEIDKKLYGNNSLQTALSLHEVGTIQLLKGMFTEAICNLEKSLEIKTQKLKQSDPDIARGLNNLAEAYRGLGNNKKALELFEQALTIFNEAKLTESQEVSPTLNNIGIILYQQGSYEKGIEFLEKALKIEQKVLGENHQNHAQTMFNMMIMLQKINKIEEAVQYGSQAYRIFLNIYPAGHPTLVQCNQVLTFLSSKLKNN